jgi:hypothetical protein
LFAKEIRQTYFALMLDLLEVLLTLLCLFNTCLRILSLGSETLIDPTSYARIRKDLPHKKVATTKQIGRIEEYKTTKQESKVFSIAKSTRDSSLDAVMSSPAPVKPESRLDQNLSIRSAETTRSESREQQRAERSDLGKYEGR